MRHDARAIAEEGIDQRALARVQERDGELAKVAKRPEQINALLEREFNAHESLLCLKQQEAGLQLIQKHWLSPRNEPLVCGWGCRRAQWVKDNRFLSRYGAARLG